MLISTNDVDALISGPGRPSGYHTTAGRDLRPSQLSGHERRLCRGPAGAAEPDPEAVDALAGEWMEGTLPETWFSVSPRRVEFQLDLVGDWFADEVTTEVRNLMPAWVRWLGERGGLPDHLRERVIAAAAPHTSDAASR